MELLTILKHLRDLEDDISRLYRWFGESFCDDADAAELFYKLSDDEVAHRDILEYERRLVVNNRKCFPDIDISIEPIIDNIDRIKEMMASDGPSIENAVRTALDFEQSAVEYYYRSAIIMSNPETASLIENLGVKESEHVDRLRMFAALKGIV